MTPVLCLPLTRSGIDVLVTNQFVSVCLLGVYMALVGCADLAYRGRYVRAESSWRASSLCSLVGFTGLTSWEVHVLLTWLVTLDRLLSLTPSLTRGRAFTARSAGLACAAAWLCGLGMAAAPLFAVTSASYGRTGLCMPLPVFPNQRQEGHDDFTFGVTVVFNLLLSALSAAGQTSIFLSLRTKANSAISADRTERNQDVSVARRLTTMTLCPVVAAPAVAVTGLLATSGGRSLPAGVGAAVALVVLPLSWGVHPLLYAAATVLDRRRLVREQRLLKIILSKRQE